MKKILYLISLMLLAAIFESTLHAAITRWPVATNISYALNGKDYEFNVNNVKLVQLYIPDAVLDEHISNTDMCKDYCDFYIYKVDKHGGVIFGQYNGGGSFPLYKVVTWRDFIEQMKSVGYVLLHSRFLGRTAEDMAESCYGMALGKVSSISTMVIPYGQSESNLCINPPPAPDSCSFLNADNPININFGDVEVGNISRTSKTINIEIKCTGAMSFNLKNMGGSGDDVYLSNGMKADVKFDGSALSDIRNMSAGATTHTLKVTLAGKPVSITAGGPFTGNVVLMINYQ